MSDTLWRKLWSTLMGTQFNGERDLYAVYGYPIKVTYEMFLTKYKRQDIASRVVDAPAQGTWRRPPAVMDDDGIDGTFAKAWEELAKKHNVYNYMERTDKLAGMGRYALLVSGFGGDTLSSPLGAEGSKTLSYLQPYAQNSVKIKSFVTDTADPRFGLPAVYEIDPSAQLGTDREASDNISTLTAVDVHASRVVHVAEGVLEGEVYGYPRMLKVYNLLEDLAKVVGGSAETFWLIANRGMQIDVDQDMKMDETDEANLSDELDEFEHGLRRFLRTRGVKVNTLGSDSPDPTGVFTMLISLVAGASGVPSRILLGSERGDLASQQDRANWANRLEERQNAFATPLMLKPFVVQQVVAGTLPQPNGEVIVIWPDAFSPTPFERAQTMAQKARAMQNLSKVANSPVQIAELEELRAVVGLDGKAPVGKDQFEEPEDDSVTGDGPSAELMPSN